MRTLVIGVAGTGKSYIVKEMNRRGLDAVDIDEGLATFVDEEGNEAQYDSVGRAKWWRTHYYVLKLGKLDGLLCENKSIYVFGSVGGKPGKGDGLLDVTHRFDRVYYLYAPMNVIRKRLALRKDNPFGKNPEEFGLLVKYKARLDKEARRMKFEVIDATLPLDEIIKTLVGTDVSSRT
jgi:shikimate kinase